MIFHVPDATFATLTSCWKRANSFAMAGNIDDSHKLASTWSNCKMMLGGEDLAEDLSALDWFASKVNKFSEANILKDDKTLAAILHEWRQAMFIDPSKLRKV